MLQYAATLAAHLCVPGAIRINRFFGWNWLTKRFKGSHKFIFIGLSLAGGFQSILGALGLFTYASDPIVADDAG